MNRFSVEAEVLPRIGLVVLPARGILSDTKLRCPHFPSLKMIFLLLSH